MTNQDSTATSTITELSALGRERMTIALRQFADVLEQDAEHKAGGIALVLQMDGSVALQSNIEVRPLR